MIPEIYFATDFLASLLSLHPHTYKVEEKQMRHFKHAFYNTLCQRYMDHWFPDNPSRGSGYRCIRINNKMDPVIEQVAASVGLDIDTLRHLFPSELTLWIDPYEVSYRFGENGSIGILYNNATGENIRDQDE